MIRNILGQIKSSNCPECDNGILWFEPNKFLWEPEITSKYGWWHCDELADPEDENKPLIACTYSVEGMKV